MVARYQVQAYNNKYNLVLVNSHIIKEPDQMDNNLNRKATTSRPQVQDLELDNSISQATKVVLQLKELAWVATED